MATLEYDSEAAPDKAWTAYASQSDYKTSSHSALNAAMKLIDELEVAASELEMQLEIATSPAEEPAEATA